MGIRWVFDVGGDIPEAKNVDADLAVDVSFGRIAMHWNEHRNRLVLGTLLGLTLVSGGVPYLESSSAEAHRPCQPARPVFGIFGEKLEELRIEQGPRDRLTCPRHVASGPPYRPVAAAPSQIDRSIASVGPRVGPRGIQTK